MTREQRIEAAARALLAFTDGEFGDIGDLKRLASLEDTLRAVLAEVDLPALATESGQGEGTRFRREGQGVIDTEGGLSLCTGCGRLPPHAGCKAICAACAPPNGSCYCAGCTVAGKGSPSPVSPAAAQPSESPAFFAGPDGFGNATGTPPAAAQDEEAREPTACAECGHAVTKHAGCYGHCSGRDGMGCDCPAWTPKRLGPSRGGDGA